MRGSVRVRSELVLDVRFIPQAAEPELRLFVRLGFADLVGSLLALELASVVELPPAEELDDVPAELSAERLADLVLGELPELYGDRKSVV